jgi:hypothetical protein
MWEYLDVYFQYGYTEAKVSIGIPSKIFLQRVK